MRSGEGDKVVKGDGELEKEIGERGKGESGKGEDSEGGEER